MNNCENDLIIENEKNVLASILLNNKYLDKCKTTIQLHDFVDGTNKLIFNAMLINDDKHISNDVSTILTLAQQRGYDIDMMYLIDIMDSLPTAENIDSYLGIMRENSNKRQLREVMEEIIVSDNMDSESISNKLKDTMDRLTVIDNTEISLIGENLKTHIDKIADGKSAEILRTSYTKLDSIIRLRRGNFLVVGARPSVGKSAYALNLVKGLLMQKYKVLFISLEMTKEEIVERLLSLLTGILHEKINERKGLSGKEKQMLYHAQKEIESYNLFVYDKGGLQIDNLNNMCRKMKQQNKLDVLILDHIGLMNTKKYSGNKVQEAGYVSNTLKQIAMDLKIVVIGLSQLSRKSVNGDTGKTREPNLADLRNTGDIEQDADSVILLHSEQEDLELGIRDLWILIRKNRAGRCATIKGRFMSEVMKIREVDYRNNQIIPIEGERIHDNVFE